jgi:hypothetical protein
MVKTVYTDGIGELTTYVTVDNNSFIMIEDQAQQTHEEIHLDEHDLELLIKDLQNQLETIKSK